MSRGILDTSTFILVDRLEASMLPDEPLITAVTLAELSVGPLITSDADKRSVRQAHLQLAESGFEPLPFDSSAARHFGAVSASLRQAGRKATARSLDAMIAATALSRGLALYTCNPRDFEGIAGLEVVAVPHPDTT